MRIPLEVHREMGLKIKEVLFDLWHFEQFRRIAKENLRDLRRADAALEKVRCALDNILAREYPELNPTEFFGTYYRDPHKNNAYKPREGSALEHALAREKKAKENS